MPSLQDGNTDKHFDFSNSELIRSGVFFRTTGIPFLYANNNMKYLTIARNQRPSLQTYGFIVFFAFSVTKPLNPVTTHLRLSGLY